MTTLSTNIFSRQSTARKVTPIPRMILNEPSGDWRVIVMNRLEELVRLEKNWDGYLGIPVSFENAIFALRMLEAICMPETPAPQIVPGNGGDLQIEWHTLNGDVELHIIAPYNVNAWRSMVSFPPVEEEIDLTSNFLSIATWVKQVTESPFVLATAAA